MTFRTRIKMCGITRQEDLTTVANAGADAIGLVFYPPSPRAVDLSIGQSLAAQCGAFMKSVVLLVDEDPGRVREILQTVKPDLIQFHGNETPDYCQQFGLSYVKALRVKSKQDVIEGLAAHKDASGIMLDAYVKGVPGGTGQCFDWSMIPDNMADRLILAGGLTPENVGEAVTQIRPYAVDVSGGIELSKGIKSAEKIAQFVSAVRQADFR